MNFTHLHVHSHYSILDGMSKVPDLVDKARRCGMNAIALTDHGDMFGIKELVDYVKKVNGKPKKQVKECEDELAKTTDAAKRADLEKELAELRAKADAYVPFKAIVGVEAYCARRTLFDKDKDYRMINPETGREQIVDNSGWHLILLAKNKIGYQNLCKLVSQAWIDGFYNRARIDKNILEKYHEGIIVSSACIAGEIPQLLLAGKVEEAEKSVRWFKSIFGEDYYLEVQRHRTDKPNADTHVYELQQKLIPMLLQLAEKTGTKVIATNDVHFVEEEHAEAHDRLICLSTGRYVDDVDRMHYTKQEWLKTPEQMSAIFADIPQVIENTQEIVDKVENYSLDSDPIMPMFPIPTEFGTEEEYRQKITEQELFDEFTRDEKGNVVLSQEAADAKIKKLGGYNKLYRIKLEADYLAKLAWDGAHKRYGDELSDDVRDRINFELHVMKTMGFPGYFLIVEDYIRAAREELHVSVGPGRGSAAGSVVAYCLRITDVDPLKYDLLFERFLNPDRISLPDIDVDFDDDGRGAVLDWVTQKYGKEKVAHIITYGTMATKSSIKDVGRVQRVPLSTVNEVVALVPDKFGDNLADAKTKKVPKVNLKNCLKYVPELQAQRNGTDHNVASMLEYAEELEGTVRQIGIHACGVIIGADDLTKFAPLSTVKDRETGKDVLVTEYDGHVVEQVGLIKMDFLGLSTLSIIKEALSNIKKTHGIDLDIDAIPIDDADTYRLYSEGRTVGIFQFESAGMQKYLKELQPTVFEDLIAMNALYRPGPMDYIPQFIARKQGKEPITYDIPCMEQYLKDTYGITVYQEQVMLLSRLLGGFTRGQSDALRKAMGKKIIATLNELKPKFIEGGKNNGHDPKVLEKIWADWEKFASYAFNKSHATCYSWVSYQTAYLKTHYPSEFMAANLTRSRDNITDVTKFMDECRHMGIKVLEPDVNESGLNFTVNEEGNIRFGLGGVKGVGEGAVDAIVKERTANGKFKDIFDFVERVNLSACNKKALESLALAGAFDSFPGTYREQYFVPTGENSWSFDDAILRYGNKFQADADMAHNSLFGGADAIEIARPALQQPPQWSTLERLNRERDLIGMYLSEHPLDVHEFEIKYLCNCTTDQMQNLEALKGRTVRIGGMITNCRIGISKKGNEYGIMTIDDYNGSFEMPLFGSTYIEYKKYLLKDLYLIVVGRIQEKGSDYKWRKPEDSDPNAPKQWEFKLQKVIPLNEAHNDLVSKITLQVPIETLSRDLADEMEEKFSKNSGTTDVFVSVYDASLRNRIIMHSLKYRISVTNELYHFLKYKTDSGELTFTVNE